MFVVALATRNSIGRLRGWWFGRAVRDTRQVLAGATGIEAHCLRWAVFNVIGFGAQGKRVEQTCPLYGRRLQQ